MLMLIQRHSAELREVARVCPDGTHRWSRGPRSALIGAGERPRHKAAADRRRRRSPPPLRAVLARSPAGTWSGVAGLLAEDEVDHERRGAEDAVAGPHLDSVAADLTDPQALQVGHDVRRRGRRG